MGSTVLPAILSLSLPVAFAADVREAPAGTFGTIAPGEIRRVPIEPDTITVPVAWMRPQGT
jgi:hypothetical protein